MTLNERADHKISSPVTSLKNSEESVPEIVIKPSQGWVSLQLKELWAYRELLFFFTWRDIKVRYKQTVLGIGWAVIQPFLTMIVFSLFFGRLAKIPSDGIPYPIFSYAALVPWTFFATRLTQASNSLVSGGNIIKKVYFPRLALPIAVILAGVVDFLLALIILLGMMVYYSIVPTMNIIWLPFYLLLAGITALGASLWLSAMNVQFRDIRYTIGFLTQLWMFLTPVAYPTSMIENPIYRLLYSLNPMVGVVDGFRWALLGTDTAPDLTMAVSIFSSIVLLVSGAMYFKRMERTFADVV